ncbi:hypothetical protein NHF46_21845 [Arthrobacter alpinus]|nr:hypothetical protein [Arthrobacter alpinus]
MARSVAGSLAGPGYAPLASGFGVAGCNPDAFHCPDAVPQQGSGDISNQHAIDTPYFLIAAVIGAVATWIMVGIVVRDIFTPAYDVVRRGGVSDPQGGILLLLREGTVSVPDAAEQLPLAAGETPIDNAEAR